MIILFRDNNETETTRMVEFGQRNQKVNDENIHQYYAALKRLAAKTFNGSLFVDGVPSDGLRHKLLKSKKEN